MLFTRRELEQQGFGGWLPFDAIRTSACPQTGGVYVVTYTGAATDKFVEKSCGGWFKDRDPTVTREALVANWVSHAEVVYIGKADNLRQRLRQFADFGAGKRAGHWGGRLIWQLERVSDLRVAWMETSNRTPLEVEAELIGAFRASYGKPPFANEPHRLGS